MSGFRKLLPKVSVLTPTWNRRQFLPKLHASLVAQTEQCFEWIVVDDGSEDGTADLMAAYLAESALPITFARFHKRVGKCTADNKLLDLARASRIIWCDSDDFLVPDAIRILVREWDRIPQEKTDEYIAVIARCKDTDGRVQNSGPESFRPFSSTWRDLSEIYGMAGDMCIMQNLTRIGTTRFPEVDLVMPESGFWHQFKGLKVICIPDVLKVMTRNTPNRISGSDRMEFCRGKAYAIMAADAGRFPSFRLKRRIRLASNVFRYAIHGDVARSMVREAFANNSSCLSMRLGSLLGHMFAAKDRLQRRVYKSHILFERGRDALLTVTSNTTGTPL
jgi:glycosyltransferase involved in cell wall biosynthesis